MLPFSDKISIQPNNKYMAIYFKICTEYDSLAVTRIIEVGRFGIYLKRCVLGRNLLTKALVFSIL